jgi:hypothetical protein
MQLLDKVRCITIASAKACARTHKDRKGPHLSDTAVVGSYNERPLV